MIFERKKLDNSNKAHIPEDSEGLAHTEIRMQITILRKALKIL